MELKINIGDAKTGKTHNVTLADPKPLFGVRIGHTFKGELLDKTGYEFTVTGGSDNAGFPMRKDVEGSGRQKVLLAGGVGFNPKRDGIRRRRTVAGGAVGPNTAQLNVTITKYGSEPLDAPVEEPAAEEATEGEQQ